MKVTFKLNGIKTQRELPTSWDEVTFRQLIAHSKAKDAAEVLSIFTGIDVETLRKAKITNLPTLLSLLSFLKTPVDYVVPKEILGYKIPQNIEIEEIQRYADLELIIKDFKDGDIANLDKYPLIVATYVVEPYEPKHAEGLSEQFWNAPAMEVLAVANFILVNIRVLSAITPLILQMRALPRNNWRRALRTLIARSVFSLSLFFLRRKLPRPVRRYLNGQLRSLSST